MGVFCVRNGAVSKALVGTSVNVPAMLNRIRFQLDHGSHPNRQLQNDWNELGSAVFSFESLDVLEPAKERDYDPSDDLAALEALWREKLSASVAFYD